MELVELCHCCPVLAGVGLACADLFLRLPADIDVSVVYLPGIDVNSGRKSVSGSASGYFFIDCVADSQRVEMAEKVDGGRFRGADDPVVSDEEARQHGAGREVYFRYCRCSLGRVFSFSTRG